MHCWSQQRKRRTPYVHRFVFSLLVFHVLLIGCWAPGSFCVFVITFWRVLKFMVLVYLSVLFVLGVVLPYYLNVYSGCAFVCLFRGSWRSLASECCLFGKLFTVACEMVLLIVHSGFCISFCLWRNIRLPACAQLLDSQSEVKRLEDRILEAEVSLGQQQEEVLYSFHVFLLSYYLEWRSPI